MCARYTLRCSNSNYSHACQLRSSLPQKLGDDVYLLQGHSTGSCAALSGDPGTLFFASVFIQLLAAGKTLLFAGYAYTLAADIQLVCVTPCTYGNRNGILAIIAAFCPKPGACSNLGCLQPFPSLGLQTQSEATAVLSCGDGRSAARPCLKKRSATIRLRGPQLNSHRSRRFGAEKGGAKSASSTSTFLSDSLSKCGSALQRVRTPPSAETTQKC